MLHSLELIIDSVSMLVCATNINDYLKEHDRNTLFRDEESVLKNYSVAVDVKQRS